MIEPTSALAELEAPNELRKPRNGPVFAQALWIFGAMLWGYVVIGEFVTSFGLPELIGAPALFAVTAIATFGALETPRRNRAHWLGYALPVALGLGLFVLGLLLAVSLSPAGVPAGAVGVALWFVAAFALCAGRQHTRRDRPRESPSLRQYFAWAMCGVSTLLALLSGL